MRAAATSRLLDLARAYAATARPVLGICLGAQLLARAWGAKVHLGAVPEFGVTHLAPTAQAATHPLLAGMAEPGPAMQWHEDRFDLPLGALLLGTAGRNQAFRVADMVWGFQCHFEVVAHGEAAEAFGRRVADRWLDMVTAG